MPKQKTTERLPEILEGKYLVFVHRECDNEDEGTAIKIERIKDGKLESIFVPEAHFGPHERNYEIIYHKKTKSHLTPSEYAVQRLIDRRVTEVTSVIRFMDFYGIPYGCQCLDEPGEDERNGICNNWFEIETLDEDSDEGRLLSQAGIRIRFFDADRNEYA